MRLFLRRQADRRSCREGKDLSWFCSYSNTTGSRCGRCNVLNIPHVLSRQKETELRSMQETPNYTCYPAF